MDRRKSTGLWGILGISGAIATAVALKGCEPKYELAEAFYDAGIVPLSESKARENGINPNNLSESVGGQKGLVTLAFVANYRQIINSNDQTNDCFVIYEQKGEKDKITRARDIQGLMDTEDPGLSYFVRPGFMKEYNSNKGLRELIREGHVLPSDLNRVKEMTKDQYTVANSTSYHLLLHPNLK